MKNKHDESIIALAFGELGEAEAARLRAEIAGSHDANELLAEYSAIKGDLKRLGVPPHQLSTERLRDAILGQGLKPKAASPWRLAWIPVAAAAIAVFSFQFLAPDRKSGVVANSVASDTSSSVVDPSLRFDPVGELVLESLPDLRDELPPRIGTASANTSVRSLANNRHGTRRNEVRTSSLDSAPKTVKPSVTTAVNTFESITPSSKDVDSADGSAFVLIEKERDANTGASRAIEISDPNNVVIGG